MILPGETITFVEDARYGIAQAVTGTQKGARQSGFLQMDILSKTERFSPNGHFDLEERKKKHE